MTESLRNLLATPGIHRQIGCSESTVSRWRTDPNRRPVAAFADPLIALAPWLEEEIREWCLPTVAPKPRKKKPADPMRVFAFRLPEKVMARVDATLAPGEDRSAVVRAGVARELARRARALIVRGERMPFDNPEHLGRESADGSIEWRFPEGTTTRAADEGRGDPDTSDAADFGMGVRS